MYPKSLEPKKGPACGTDFSLLIAISVSNPQATTLLDLGINSSSSTTLKFTLIFPSSHLRSMHHSWCAHCTPPRMFLSVCLTRLWTPRTSTGTRRPHFWIPSGRCSWHQCCLLQLPCRLMTTMTLYQNQDPTGTPTQHPIRSIETLPCVTPSRPYGCWPKKPKWMVSSNGKFGKL
jgi:hypothetical protein